MHRVVNDEDIYAIHEAYFDNNKETSISEDPVQPNGTSLDELKHDCEHYLKALERPILEYDDF